MEMIRFLRRNKMYDEVPESVKKIVGALCGLIGVSRPNNIIITDDIPEGEYASYDPDIDVVYIKRGYRDAKMSVLDSMPAAISCGLKKKRYFLHPEEVEADKRFIEELYKIAEEAKDKEERIQRIYDAVFPHHAAED